VAPTAMPDATARDRTNITELTKVCSKAAKKRHRIRDSVRHRILDFAQAKHPKLSHKLDEWWKLDFAALRYEVKRVFRTEVPVKERSEWEAYLAEQGDTVRALTAEIETAEREIDAVIYRLFDLSSEEIVLLETAIAA